jgi:Tfp pilus assembly PilM family ATPase
MTTPFASLRDSSGPTAAVEIAATRVSGASLEWRGGQAAVTAHALETLPEGALVPSLTAANVVDRVVLPRVAGVEQLDGPAASPWSPDPVAKVSLIRFERVPARMEDLDELVRWQVRKTALPPLTSPDHKVPGQQRPTAEFVVSLARREVIVDYEQLAAAEGAHAGIVDLATFNVINAILAAQEPSDLRSGSSRTRAAAVAPSGDWLLVNVAPDYVTLAILRGPNLIFFRNRAAETDGTLADLVHQTAMYYEDRLSGGGFERVLLAGGGGGGARHAGEVDLVRRSLQDRLAATVDTVDPRAAMALTDRISAGPVSDALAPPCRVLCGGRSAENLEKESRDPRESLHPALLQRARGAALAACAGCHRGGRQPLQYRPCHPLFADRHGTRRQASRDEARSADLRAEAARLRGSVDLQQIEVASTEARQANELIDRRTFSWTDLFNQFEATFPNDVRITAVRPTIDEKGALVLAIDVVARSVENRRADSKSRRHRVIQQSSLGGGAFQRRRMLEASLEGHYTPRQATPAAPEVKKP